MSKILRRCLSLALASMLLASLLIVGTINASADYKTGNGLAAYAMTAYNEGWSYVWGGASYGAVDCSGLIYSYVGGGARVTEDMLYSSPESGYVSDGVPDIPGLGLWQPGHVGVYVGSGMAVDARDEISNVCYDSVSNKAWVMWFKVQGISYGDDNSDKAVTNEEQSDTDEKSDISLSEQEDNTLSFGSTGSEVNKLQERLKTLGYFSDNTTEYFGYVTKGALEEFQQAAGLDVTGVLDEATETALWDSNAPTAPIENGSDEDDTALTDTQTNEEDTSLTDTQSNDDDTAITDTQTNEDDTAITDTQTNDDDTALTDTQSDEDETAVTDTQSDEDETAVTDTQSDEDDTAVTEVQSDEPDPDELTDDYYNGLEESFDAGSDEDDDYNEEHEEGEYELNDGEYGFEDGGAVTESELSVPEEESILEDGAFAHFEEYTGPLAESSANADEENDTVQDVEKTQNAAEENEELDDAKDVIKEETASGNEMSVTVDLNKQDNTSLSNSGAVSADKQTNDEAKTIKSPKTGDNTLSVLVEGGIDELLTPEFGVIAALVTLVVVFFLGTIHYWNVSMEKRRQRARKSTTVSFYHRSGI